jgi:hypothetical protein
VRRAAGIAIMILASGVARGQSLEQLEKCVTEARKTFQADSHKDRIESGNLGMITISDGYQSYYNTRINRCLILWTKTFIFSGEIATSKYLYDANERNEYAWYLWTTQTDKKYWGVKPVDCEFITTFGQQRFCASDAEFDAYVTEYMR